MSHSKDRLFKPFKAAVSFPVFLVHEMHIVQTKRTSGLNNIHEDICCSSLCMHFPGSQCGSGVVGNSQPDFPSSRGQLRLAADMSGEIQDDADGLQQTGDHPIWVACTLLVLIGGGVPGVINNFMLDISRVAPAPVILDTPVHKQTSDDDYHSYISLKCFHPLRIALNASYRRQSMQPRFIWSLFCFNIKLELSNMFHVSSLLN